MSPRGRLAGPADLYRTLTHIRLSGKLANFIYSLETTDTDFYAYQFKPVVKLLQSVNRRERDEPQLAAVPTLNRSLAS